MGKRGILKRYFGYDDFLPGQEAVIDSLLLSRDTLAVLPTGGGKSLCFQIPALMLPGITLVVSPLISLQIDQVTALVRAGVNAAYLNSTLSPGQYQKALRNAAQGKYKLIYISPERLMKEDFLRFAKHVGIAMIAVDEAHCISHWGHDFRPDYLGIAQFIRALPTRPIVSAFTATATKRVRKDIIANLSLLNPGVFVNSFDRPNLRFAVQKPEHKPSALLTFLHDRKDQCGIVYCRTRLLVDEVTRSLNNAGFPALRYHAGLDDRERTANQRAFTQAQRCVMVATNAFGMGIDKPDVAYVVHYNMPGDVESYYQEAGRAGRNGAQADCLLLFSYDDIRGQKYLINHSGDDTDNPKRRSELIAHGLQRLEKMSAYVHEGGCLRGFILRYFGETPASRRCERCGNCQASAGDRRRLGYGHAVLPSFFRSSGVSYRPPRTQEPLPAPIDLKAAEAAREKAATLAAAANKLDQRLLDRLMSCRETLAAQWHIKPFFVFSEDTLMDMCLKRPRSEHELRRVLGMSEHKLSRFGRAFLDEIAAHAREGGE
jgi:ATP-dependent DNA helicase RecQ